MSLDMFFQHFFNALTLGSLYGLIAIGYTMVYGILRLINFAHGDILMLGAYFVFYGTTTFFLPWGVAVVVAILAASAVGILVDRIAYRPLRDAPRISALISAIAVSFFIESLSVVVFSGLPRPVYQPEWLMTPINFGQLKLLPITLVVPVVIIALAFGLGSALAAASGIMWALRYPQINPYMGIFPGFKAFIAAVLGGIGSIQGAMIGGLLLGFIEIMTVAFMPSLSGYRDAFAFVVLVLVLLVRPTGLFGQRSEEKI